MPYKLAANMNGDANNYHPIHAYTLGAGDWMSQQPLPLKALILQTETGIARKYTLYVTAEKTHSIASAIAKYEMSKQAGRPVGGQDASRPITFRLHVYEKDTDSVPNATFVFRDVKVAQKVILPDVIRTICPACSTASYALTYGSADVVRNTP